MLPVLLAVCIFVAPSTPVERLTAYISKRQPRAKPYARTLARSILRESKRVGIDPAVMVAVAWIESRFNRRMRGSAKEEGLYQLMRSDSRMVTSWARLYPTKPTWRSLSREAVIEALRDVQISTYLAADELAGVAAWCRRAGHRIGYHHKHPIDRYGHHQSGPKPSRPSYLRALRWQYRKAQAVLRAR